MSQDRYRNSTGNAPRDSFGDYEPVSPRERERVRDDHFSHGALPIRTAGGVRPYPEGSPDGTEPRTYCPHELDEASDRGWEKERTYVATRRLSPSPPRIGKAPRPGMLRRQSSLETYDRLPARFFDREEYETPIRRGDYHHLPRLRRLPPAGTSPQYFDEPSPRRGLYYDTPETQPSASGRVDPFREAAPLSGLPARRYFHDDAKISEPVWHADEEFHPVKEKEVVHERESRRSRRSRRRGRSRSHSSSRSRSPDSPTTAITTKKSHATANVSRSRSCSSSSSSSSSSSDASTIKNKYPKKGKTRIPARLVSKRALCDLGYPFEEDGTTIVVLVALGQQNIDDVLKLSEDYRKGKESIGSYYAIRRKIKSTDPFPSLYS